MPPLLRVLALDDEFLIALDAQFVLSDFDWVSVEARMSEHFRKIDFQAFDVVLLDPHSRFFDRREADKLAEEHAVVFGTVDSDDLELISLKTPTVAKPYQIQPLMEAMIAALERRQPNKARSVIAAVAASGP